MSWPALWASLFWCSAAVTVVTFAGYGWIMRMLARTRPPLPSPTLLPHGPWPAITVILVVRNEEARVQPRIENLLASAYPPEALRVIVVSDGSSDLTATVTRAIDPRRVTVLEQPERRGKAHGLNLALAAAQTELVVFADARQRFAPETIARLAAHFSDARVGAVSGSLEIETARSGIGRGIDDYWRAEKRLRAAEARWDSCIGCTGAVYAARRALIQPLPEDTLLDDVVIPMRLAQAGARVLHDEHAVAYDPQTLEPEREQARKRRTLAGNFQMLFRYPEWLLPWRHRLWAQLLAHKYLRLAAPLFLLAMLLANAALLPGGCAFYRFALAGQLSFYGLAVVGSWWPLPGRWRYLSLPASFVLLQFAVLRAAWDFARGAQGKDWGSPAP